MLFSDLAVGQRFQVVERGENFHAEVLATIFTKIEDQKDAEWSGTYNAVSTNAVFPDMWVRPTTTVDVVPEGTCNGVYDIPVEAFQAINERIEELNRRAEKLGVESRLGLHVIQKRTVLDGVEEYQRAIVRLVGKAPRLDGWALIAILQHDPMAERPFFRPVPGCTVPEQYRTADAENCDHCHARRQRKDTYIVQHQDGRAMQVGSSCLRDFLGHQSPAVLLAWAELVQDLDGFVEGLDEGAPDDEETYGHSPRYDYLPLQPYMCHVAHMIKRDGWVSRSRAEELMVMATAERAFVNMRDLRKKLSHATPPTAEDAALAKAAIAWAKDMEDPYNDYLLNLNTLANMMDIPFNMRGFAASMIPAYQRAMETERRRAVEQAASEWVGEVKKRQEFGPLTVMGITYIESQWGCTSLHRFVDKDGNQLVWFASSETLTEGAVYQGKATVVEHSEYHGVKQTVINRCKFEQMEVA